VERPDAGSQDLDLLVWRLDAQRFIETLERLGFKEARPVAAGERPGVVHCYGYDGKADRIVRVHARLELAFEGDAIKKPSESIEQALLRDLDPSTASPQASAEVAFIAFVCQMLVENAAWTAVLPAWRRRLSRDEREKLEHLEKHSDRSRTLDVFERKFAGLPARRFDEWVVALRPGSSRRSRLRAGRQVCAALRAQARRRGRTSRRLAWWQRIAPGVPRYLGGRGRMGLASGGELIALVGADGAGKSSAIDALYDWLSPHLRVEKVHMGKPRWSWSTFPVKAALKVFRYLSGLRGRWGSPASPSSRDERGSLGQLIWHTVTARDRYRAYHRARRLAARGALVLCDRFPLPYIESMDGRRARGLAPAWRPWPVRMLIDLEERYYAAIPPPELLIVMRVHPDVALQRRPEDPEGRVRKRALEVLEVDGPATGAHLVDANVPMREVHRELKSWIWSQL
jgi:thymidylate kinase